MAVVCMHVGDEQSLESKIVQWCHGRAGAVVPREDGGSGATGGQGQWCHGRAGGQWCHGRTGAVCHGRAGQSRDSRHMN